MCLCSTDCLLYSCVCFIFVLNIISFFFFYLLLFFFFFFFFQAEDGIRDTSVTGVQTCALPIYRRRGRAARRRSATTRSRICRTACGGARAAIDHVSQRLRLNCRAIWPRDRCASDRYRAESRSEERRVGKEVRHRWALDHEKKHK